MANRRMFSLRIINSAKFLKMPISSQALYFHLGMRADDDGIVEAFTTIRLVGCTEDDLRVLVAKGFVQVLNEDLITYITDWNENNKIRPDRKIDSMYKDLLLKINPDAPLIEKKERADTGRALDGQWTTNGQPMDNQMPDKGPHRLGKDRLGKDRLGNSSGEKRTRFVPPTLEEVKAYCEERNNGIDPHRFVDFYSSKGWMIGKNKMKDWRAAVRSWERINKEQQKKIQDRNKFNQFEHNEYDFDKLEKELGIE